ncbi:MAG TPA: hypothetical protein PKM26_06480, partial [Syntrophorhabdaceae bacterium]|nr:hypothetical protein [Syntrophorhabdaceae bacterium]
MARIHKKLGELLLDAKKITEKDLLRALTEQKAYGDKLGKVIVKLGMLSEKEIIDTVSKQLNIPIVDHYCPVKIKSPAAPHSSRQ